MTELLYSSFERCCRLCAEEQDVTIMIFSHEAEAMLLQNKLTKYLLIEVEEDDKLPKNICIQCCTKLQTVCDFIDTARKAQDVLLDRSLSLEDIAPDNFLQVAFGSTNKEPNSDHLSDKPNYNYESKYTEIEVSVDPMIVLQNSEESLSPTNNDDLILKDVTYLHSVDAENVTIKLIKNDEQPQKKSDSSDEDRSDGPKPFSCLSCKRSFCTEVALQNHSWQHFNTDNSYEKYKCLTCLEAFYYKKDLIMHSKQHHINGLCQLCGRTFRSEQNYITHMSVHFSANKSFPCKICGRSYNTWGKLKTHSVTHSTERPYQCHFCKKTFKRNQDLKFHINQHTGAKPYKCPFCDKSFASSGNCYSHRNRMHPGKCMEDKIKRWNAPPREPINRSIRHGPPKNSSTTFVKGLYKYQCELCNASFLKRDNFTYHMYQHTGEKPFQCSFCSEKFVTKRGLLLHHDKEHPGKSRPLALISKNILLK